MPFSVLTTIQGGLKVTNIAFGLTRCSQKPETSNTAHNSMNVNVI